MMSAADTVKESGIRGHGSEAPSVRRYVEFIMSLMCVLDVVEFDV